MSDAPPTEGSLGPEDLNASSVLASPQTPSTPKSSKKDRDKMKFEVVNAEGKMELLVISSPKDSKSSKKRTTDRSKKTKSKSNPKKKDKVASHSISPKPSEPHKPLMGLRHILKKHEKKKEKPVMQETPTVDFYGSMSAIPWLNSRPIQVKDKTKKAAPKKEKTAPSDGKLDTSDASLSSFELEVEESSSPIVTKLPTKEEIVVTAEYDEDQLKLWKSMSSLDGALDVGERPAEMLPLRPTKRPEKKKKPPPSGVRAFSRPEDWLNPHLKTPEKKGYRVSMDKDKVTENAIHLEDDGASKDSAGNTESPNPEKQEVEASTEEVITEADPSSAVAQDALSEDSTRETEAPAPPMVDKSPLGSSIKNRISMFSNSGNVPSGFAAPLAAGKKNTDV